LLAPANLADSHACLHTRPNVKPTPPPHPQPKTLDELLANAEHFALYCMRNTGSITPALFLTGPDGSAMFIPQSLADVSEKDKFANQCRLMCIAHAATACVMVLEAWAKFAKNGEALDPGEAPSEAMDRREVVMLMAESKSGQKQKLLPIIRSGNGRFFGFGEPELPDLDGLQGRFAQILPPKAPDATMRELAKAMMQVQGAGKALSARLPRRL
jgi:hypothetical protein